MQITDTILMIRPKNFGFNPETAASNAFQQNESELNINQVSTLAIKEFNELVKKLEQEGIKVYVIEDTKSPIKTDAVFPNNWLTTHEDGSIITYPMLSDNRRLERREDIVNALRLKFDFTSHVKLEEYEKEGKILEGTGSMVLDRKHRIVYACLSSRTNGKVLDEFCDKMGYDKIFFRAVDGLGQPIYHTNVMMALGQHFVVICLGTIKDKKERASLLESFAKTNKEVIEINLFQMMAFAGNMLQVKSAKTGRPYLVMSERAFESLTSGQIASLEKYNKLVHSPLEVIETFGGGSARCMMAEIFYP